MAGDEVDTWRSSAAESGSGLLSLLLVEPDAEVRASVASAAEQDGVSFEFLDVGGVEAAAVEEPMVAVERSPIDCVVAEFDLLNRSVADLLKQLGAAGVDLPVVVFTARDPADVSRAGWRRRHGLRPEATRWCRRVPAGQGSGSRRTLPRDGQARRGPCGAATGHPPRRERCCPVGSGSIPDGGAETPIDDVAAVLAQGDRFREALGRAAAEEEREEWVWPRVEEGAIEHRGIPLPALEDAARLSILRDVTA